MLRTNDPSVRGRKKAVITAIIAVIVISVVTIVIIYESRRAPFRISVLTVNDNSIKMSYFLKRLYWSRGDAAGTLQALTNEEIIKQTAPYPPYNLKITPSEVDQFLKEIASKKGGLTNEHEFEAWYHQQLEDTRLSDLEYREILLSRMLRQRMTLYLKERVSTVTEQVHLYMIVQESTSDALLVKKRIDSGEDFFIIAGQVNVDPSLKAQGGDLGWLPRSALA